MKQSLEDKAFSDAILERYATKTQAEYNHAKSTLVYMAIGERMLLPNDTWGRQELVKRAQRIGGYILEGRYLVRVAKLESAQQPIVFGTDGYRKGFSWIKNLPPVGWTGTTSDLKAAVGDAETLTSFGRRLRIFNESTGCLDRMTKCSTRPWRVKEHPEDYDLFDTFIKDPQ
jgi:hypothetical protein